MDLNLLTMKHKVFGKTENVYLLKHQLGRIRENDQSW